MGGYTPFSPAFSNYDFTDPLEEERKRRIAEERRKLELADSERTQLRASMDREPSWDDPVADVSGRLPEVEDPNPGSVVESEKAGQKREYLEMLAEHIKSMPDASDPENQQGMGELFMSYWNPSMRSKTGHTRDFHNKASQWESKRKALGEVAGLSRDWGKTDATRHTADVAQYGHETRAETSDEDRVVSLQNAETRVNELKLAVEKATSQEEQFAITQKLDQAKLEVERTKAETGQSRAESYGANIGDVEDIGSLKWARKEHADREPNVGSISPTQQTALEKQALDDVIAMNPEWEKFARFHESTGDVLGREGMIPGEGLGPDFFYGDTPAAEDPDYQEFIVALEAARIIRGLTSGLQDIPALPQMGGE